MRPFWLPVIAAPLAIVVGVGGFLLTSPLAPPAQVAPELIDGFTLTPASELLSLVEPTDPPAGSDAAAGAGTGAGGASSPLTPALIPVVDPSTAQAASLLLADQLAMLDALGSDDGVLPEGGAIGVTVLDPCAEEGSTDCPSGARGTVLASTSPPPLVVSATTSRAFCGSLVVGSGRAGVAITTTRPVSITATVSIGEVSRIEEIATTDADREAWLASGETGTWNRIVHCLQLDDLPPGGRGNVRIVAVDDTWEVATTNVPVDVEGGPGVPPSWVHTRGNSTVMISVPRLSTTAVGFSAFVVPPDAEPAGCSFEGNPDQLEPVYVDRQVFSREQMVAEGYLPAFAHRDTAVFVVPEASSITVCAGFFDSGSVGALPDSVFGEVLRSPDLVTPVITFDSYALTVRSGYDDLRLSAGVGAAGSSCGFVDVTLEDVGLILCNYARRPADRLGWDGALVVSATATAFGSTGTRTYTLPVAPQICGFGCRIPENQVFDVPLHSRTDPCIGGGCPQSLVGTARLRVSWFDGDASGANDWVSEGAADPAPRDPIMDRSATVELGPLDTTTETQAATVSLSTDRATTVTIEIAEPGAPEGVGLRRTIVDDVFAETHTLDLGSLPAAGRTYALVATIVDREGNTSVYTANADRRGRIWVGGYIVTDPVEVDLDVELTVRRTDGQPIGMGNYAVGIGGARSSDAATEWRSPRDPAECAPEELILSPGDPTVVGTVTELTQIRVRAVVFEPQYPVTGVGDCSEAEQIYQWWWSGPVRELELVGYLTLDQLRSGATLSLTRDGYEVDLAVRPGD